MVYVTDSLRLFAQGKYLTQRWIDVINPTVIDIDTDEVITDLFSRAGLVVK